ncbi:hypothetical protein [Streptomyces sp. NPDC015350]|uniref:hypothetical protein n=1 Tax=Streptomyces sp. NPDC015350 TaxID=3364955 RepID=UPI0036FF41C1
MLALTDDLDEALQDLPPTRVGLLRIDGLGCTELGRLTFNGTITETGADWVATKLRRKPTADDKEVFSS